MKRIKNALLLLTSLMFIVTSAYAAKIKNIKTENVKVYGNCDICKTTIEKAGNLNNVAQVDWNKDTKMAIVTFDSTKTSQTEILKRIALVGYDSDQFLAPDEVYEKLPECCHYERINKSVPIQNKIVVTNSMQNKPTTFKNHQEATELKAIFDNYFLLKDALVKSDQKSASLIAVNLLASINEVKMDKLTDQEHIVWMKVMSSLKSNTDKISTSKNLDKQRNAFMDLSANMYDLMKVSKQDTPVYFQHCPMYNDGKGADWISKENEIKNPYYGSQMITCGNTVETIK
jgi:copper chaperone CopZ